MENMLIKNADEIRQELLEIRERIDALIAGLADEITPAMNDTPIDIDLDEVSLEPAGLEAAAEAASETSEAETVSTEMPDSPSEPQPQPQRKSRSTQTFGAKNRSWKVDIPGSRVSNIISGISLNDRVLFINTLFGEDPGLFQKTIAALNGMTSLDEAEAYLEAEFPDWNYNSDVVYRLMMAARRKLM